MIRSTIIALTATAALGLAFAPAAQAKNNIDFNVNLGFSGGYIGIGNYNHHDGYYGHGNYAAYDDDCHYVKVKHKKKLKHGKVKVWFTKQLVCY
jgi:hypothetical protein